MGKGRKAPPPHASGLPSLPSAATSLAAAGWHGPGTRKGGPWITPVSAGGQSTVGCRGCSDRPARSHQWPRSRHWESCVGKSAVTSSSRFSVRSGRLLSPDHPAETPAERNKSLESKRKYL